MSKLQITCISLLLIVAGTVSSLRVEIDTQAVAVERHNVIMECRFDLEAATFKSVRWSKNGKEFLSMVQSREPFLEAYHVPGINLDLEKTKKTQIALTRLNRLSSGNYQCSVSTSGNATEEANANLTVVERGPVSVLVGTKTGYLKIETQNFSEATESNDVTPVYSIGYDFQKKKIYYSKGEGKIFKADYSPESVKPESGLMVSTGGIVTSIAVDWIHNVLYFTDSYLNTIGSIDLDTEEKQTLIEGVTNGVFKPESIVVDPFQKYLFWGDNNINKTKIVASGLDGRTNRHTIVDTNLKIAILTLDLERRRLFYISDEGLTSCKYDGSNRKLLLQHPTLYDSVNSLSFYDDYVYWSRHDGSISSGLFSMALIDPELPVSELPIKHILDLKVFHESLQKSSIVYSCDDIECSHECSLSEEGSAECSCPANFTLTAGNTICNRM